MCRETQFYSHSFGEGVSETESEEDEEDNVPTPTPSLHGSSCQSIGPRTARRRLGSMEVKGADSFSSSTSFDKGENRFRDQSASVGQGFVTSALSVASRFGGGGGSSFGGQSSAEERRRGGEGRKEDDRGREEEKDLGGPLILTPDLDRETAGSKRNSQVRER